MFEDCKKVLLDGIWDFAFLPEKKAEEMLPEAFPAFDAVAMVPGCFDAAPGMFGKRGTGLYRTSLRCGGRIRLALGGSGLVTRIFWNRVPVGESRNSWLAEEFIFDAGDAGRHELVIAVDNMLRPDEMALFHLFYDFYGFGGIYGSVSAEMLPPFFIERVAVVPCDINSGEVEVCLFCAGENPAGLQAECAFDGGERFPVAIRGRETRFRRRVPAFRLWSPETPHLHSFEASLNGMEVATSFGIRSIEAENGELLLNGKALKLIGYNRHESHPTFGAATPPSLIYEDLRMIREQGCNFIRGCHYPQREEFLNLCDRLGILVWEESLGWGNPPEQLNDPEFRRRQLEQTVKMVRKSINHPSVILWGFLNEADLREPATREIVSELRQGILAEDTSRPISFATCHGRNCCCLDLADVISFNLYPGWYVGLDDVDSRDTVKPTLDEMARFASSPEFAGKPLLIGELGASAIPGDHSGMRWSEEYQATLLESALSYVLESPRYCGLAIWQFANSRTCIQGHGCLHHPAGLNNKGVVDEYRRPKLAWHCIGKILKQYKAK